MINTVTKDFRLVVTKIRDTEKIKAFITRYIPPGNFIVTDGWQAILAQKFWLY